MSRLGVISNQVLRTEDLLSDLNRALLRVKTAGLGRASEFGLSQEEVDTSRLLLETFLEKVVSFLQGTEASTLGVSFEEQAASRVVQELRAQGKPISDWKDDLEKCLEALRSSRLDKLERGTIEYLLSILDQQVSLAMRQLMR